MSFFDLSARSNIEVHSGGAPASHTHHWQLHVHELKQGISDISFHLVPGYGATRSGRNSPQKKKTSREHTFQGG